MNGSGSPPTRRALSPRRPVTNAMSLLRIVVLLVALLGLAACCRRIEEASPVDGRAAGAGKDAAATGPRDAGVSILRYDTGDRAEWPDYDLPRDHRFNPPEVPESIRGPFPLETIPKD